MSFGQGLNRLSCDYPREEVKQGGICTSQEQYISANILEYLILYKVPGIIVYDDS